MARVLEQAQVAQLPLAHRGQGESTTENRLGNVRIYLYLFNSILTFLFRDKLNATIAQVEMCLALYEEKKKLAQTSKGDRSSDSTFHY